MSFPGIIRRLFANNGAGPKLRKDILPSHADTHAPGGSDPIDFPESGVSAEAFAKLQQQVAALAGSLGQGDPWDIFPLRVPIPVVGVTFGGSDGRRAIMPGETEAREDWILCDGGSDGKGGTVPDLRGRMILGASDEHPAGSSGGSETHSHSISGTVGSSGSHSHTLSGSVSAMTLSTSQMPTHSHLYTCWSTSQNGVGNGTFGGFNKVLQTLQVAVIHTPTATRFLSEVEDHTAILCLTCRQLTLTIFRRTMPGIM